MVNILSPQDIIQTSLVGLGLIIALYAILTDKIKELQKTKNSKRSRWIENRKNMLGKMVNDIDNIDLDEEFEELKSKEENIILGKRYSYRWGYFISGVLFIGSIIFAFLALYDANIFIDSVNNMLFIISTLFFIVGLGHFSILWIITMFDMRSILIGDIELIQETEKELDKEIIKKDTAEISIKQDAGNLLISCYKKYLNKSPPFPFIAKIFIEEFHWDKNRIANAIEYLEGKFFLKIQRFMGGRINIIILNVTPRTIDIIEDRKRFKSYFGFDLPK